MAQLFPPQADPIFRTLIALVALGLLSLVLFGGKIVRSAYVTEVDIPIVQPVQFSHEHHVGGLGIDCRYCHTSVEVSASAGMPSTKTCMTCHSQIWTDAAILEPVRQSWRTGLPIVWERVTNVPDFAHFAHNVHINSGVACVSCHGRVDQMPLLWKAQSMQMEWCLSCHWDPGPWLVPRKEVFNMAYTPPPDQSQGRERAAALGIDTYEITRCSVCHY